MGLPRRQQAILDQIERALHSGDPQLRSMFAAFHRSAKERPVQHEAISGWSLWQRALVCLIVASVLGGLVVGIRTTSNDCPGLSSDQVVASAAVRYAGCSKSTEVWSRGGR